ncbi:MAG TPA: hypothetical protein VLT33_20295, partial [Labilithrix sp.]|nr:hypothetical protein [Labilithrix sp.]
MQAAIQHATPAVDLSTLSAARLCELVPALGLFPAEDIVAWRDAHGAFPDAQTLTAELGLPAEVATELLVAVGLEAPAERVSGLHPQGTAELADDAPASAVEDDADDDDDDDAPPEPETPAPDTGSYFPADGLVELVDDALAGLPADVPSSDLFADALADLAADAPAERESPAPRAEPS